MQEKQVTIDVAKFKKIMGGTISILVTIIILLICNGLIMSAKIKVIRDNYNDQIEDLEQSNLSYKMRNAELENLFSTTENGFIKLSQIAVDLDSSNSELKEVIEEQNKMIKHYKNRAELYDKYEFALFYDDSRTDINYEYISSLEEMAAEKDYGLDSVVLTLAIIMTESHGKADADNPSSSASGFGQLLDSTARFTYEELLNHGKGTYKKEYVFDPKLNLYMTITYINYLAKENNYNPMATIDDYRGFHDTEYLRMVQSYLDKAEIGPMMNLRLE